MNIKLKQAVKIVYDYLSISDIPEEADCIFLVGGSSLLPTKKVVELYKKGYATKIFFDTKGGTFSNPEFMKQGGEAVVFHNELLKLGVKNDDIFYKNKAMNTLEEVLMAIPLMKENGINPKSIILVDRPIHQRREWACFKKHFPEIKYINCPADEACDYSDETIKRIIMEMQRLEKYAIKGDLEFQKIPKVVAEAYNILTENFKVAF